MRAATKLAIERAQSIEWRIGGCDYIAVDRSADGWVVRDSRGVRQGSRLVSEHATLDDAVASAMRLVEAARSTP